LGNSCFANSIVQALCAQDIGGLALRSQPWCRGGEFCPDCALYHLSTELKDTQRGSIVNPSTFFNGVLDFINTRSIRGVRMEAGEQQVVCNAHFLVQPTPNHTLESTCVNPPARYISTASALTVMTAALQDAHEFLLLLLDGMRTCATRQRISDDFQGSVHTRVTCSVCNQTSTREESGHCIVSVNVCTDPRGLQAALEDEMKTEVITCL
jgi:ubiquitin C-terminal hydrolase